MKKSYLILLIVAWLTLSLSKFSYCEPPSNDPGGNPFGNVPEAPPAPPGSEFQEDDNFLDPGSNFGFQPPVAQPSNPEPSAPPSQPPAKLIPPRPLRPAPSTPTPSNANKMPFSPPMGKVATGNASKKKESPKLADYLELDPSIKSLEVKNFDLPDKEIKDVVTLISKWTGKNFIIDQKVRGRITIMGPSAVSLQEAYQAFLSSLEANGLTTVQSGKYIRIIDSAEARRAPVKTYAGDYAPKDDQFITRIFQLKFINADEVQ
ncbi:MAG: hypothetical protein ACKOA8_06780, partial [Deltaproteobacteria bacterium]